MPTVFGIPTPTISLALATLILAISVIVYSSARKSRRSAILARRLDVELDDLRLFFDQELQGAGRDTRRVLGKNVQALRAQEATGVKRARPSGSPRKVNADLLERFNVDRVPISRSRSNSPLVGVILDPFSELALRYEWNQVQFGPEDWRQVLDDSKPDMLFVESAWQGNQGRWRLHMTRSTSPSDELRALVEWCKNAEIPTVFWNKEDPPNYDRFIETAKLFDYVYTVDADRLKDYRRDLEHDRIGLLPFAAQPKIHNPIQHDAGRDRAVAFAGSYFAEKHPERRAQMDYVLKPALEWDLDIYSRMQAGNARYRFPVEYIPRIVGSLPYEHMLNAYTAYKVFLNVNSVTNSKTMCSRRLFELSAAQTAIITAPAASVEPFFGDTVMVTNSAEETQRALSTLLNHAEYRDRLALRAHRRVYEQHLYSHRVNRVLQDVLKVDPLRTPTISIIVPTNRPAQVEHVLRYVSEQTYPHIELILVAHGIAVDADGVVGRAHELGVERTIVLSVGREHTLGHCMNVGAAAASGDYVAKMDDDNYYGPNYLKDLIQAFEYTDAEVVGKWAHFAYLEASSMTLLRFPDSEHRYVRLIQGGTMLMPRQVVRELGFEDVPRAVDTTFLAKVAERGGRIYAADRYNFVSVRRSDPDSHTWKITEPELLAKKSQLLFYGEPFNHATV